jgi:cytochrome b561
MRLRNDDTRYGAITKLLHWVTVLAVATQFVVGYSIARGEDTWEGVFGKDDSIVLVHAALGLGILTLALVRLLWRASGQLPAWAPALSSFERALEARLEKTLYLLLFLIPPSGLALLLGSGEDWKFGHDREWEAPFEVADDGTVDGAHRDACRVLRRTRRACRSRAQAAAARSRRPPQPDAVGLATRLAKSLARAAYQGRQSWIPDSTNRPPTTSRGI